MKDICFQDQPPAQMGQVPMPVQVPIQAPTGPINPSVEQMTKLKSELTIVNGNIKVMGDMLTELNPSNVDSSDLELLQVRSLTLTQTSSDLELLQVWPLTLPQNSSDLELLQVRPLT